MKHQRRSYGLFCGLAAALDVLGEHWTLLIVRELMFSSQRYGELLHNLPGLGTNLLAERLKQLTRAGVITHHPVPDDSRAVAYELIPAGGELREVILGLSR